MHKHLALPAEPFISHELVSATSTLSSIIISFPTYLGKLFIQSHPSESLLSAFFHVMNAPFKGLSSNIFSSFGTLYLQRALIEIGQKTVPLESEASKETLSFALALFGGTVETLVNRAQDAHARAPHTSFLSHLSLKMTKDLGPASIRNAATVLGCTLFPVAIQTHLNPKEKPGLEAILWSTLLTASLSAGPDYVRECLANLEKNTTHLRHTLAQYTHLPVDSSLQKHWHQLQIRLSDIKSLHPTQQAALQRAASVTHQIIENPHSFKTAVRLMNFCHNTTNPLAVGARMFVVRSLFSLAIIGPIVGIEYVAEQGSKQTKAAEKKS